MSSSKDKKFQTESKYNRCFSEEFKKQKVKELLEKKITIRELCSLYEISRASAYKWLYLYSNLERGTKMVVQMESEYSKTQYLQSRLAELERIIGQKQMEIDYLEAALKCGSEEVGYDIKKSTHHHA
jgi:transposase-like protein